MPTVHLSLPEQVYRELKEYASEMGVQTTDLIKMFIREGLEKLRREREERMRRSMQRNTELLLEILRRIEELEKRFGERLDAIEGDIHMLKATVRNMKKRLSRLEDVVEEQLIPVETPEIIRP